MSFEKGNKEFLEIKQKYTVSQTSICNFFGESYDLDLQCEVLQEIYMKLMFMGRYTQSAINKFNEIRVPGKDDIDSSEYKSKCFDETLNDEMTHFKNGGDTITDFIVEFREKYDDSDLNEFVDFIVENFAERRKEFRNKLEDIMAFKDLFNHPNLKCVGKLLDGLMGRQEALKKSAETFFNTFKSIADLTVSEEEETDKESNTSPKKELIERVKEFVREQMPEDDE